MPIYLQYDSGKLKGDVTAEGHQGWIELKSLQWGVGRGICTKPGKVTDRESSAPSVEEVVISKTQDVATIDLLQEALTGRGVWAQIDLCKTDSGKLEVYLSYLMENCMISGYEIRTPGDRPEEVLSLNFTAIECSVTPGGQNGKPGNTNRVTYDLATATV